jgi:5-methyltetrahydropteroyltriglutamate--homocysteine methyltransferase
MIQIISAGRKKLEKLGVKLPLYPVSSMGAFPKHEELKEIRYKVEKGVQPASELDRKEKLSTDLWIREQERAKVDVFVDGGMNRDDIVAFFAGKLGGMVPGGFVRCFNNSYYRKPVIQGPIEWRTPITVPLWQYAQRLTHKPVKAIVTGPYTLMDWSFNTHYKSREALCRDLAGAVRKEIAALVDNGAKIIQIDEPALSAHPLEFPLFADAFKEIATGVNAYIVLNHAYGELAPFWLKLQALPFDQLHVSHINPFLSVLPLVKKKPTKKDISVGVIETQALEQETPRQLNDRVRDALKAVPKGQLWFSFDAGLQSHSVDQASRALQNLTQTVAKLR